VTLGDIARIRAAKGEVDAALQLHQETLGICEGLGDLDGMANALWSIAQIELRLQKLQDAFDHLAKSYEIVLRLGRLDGICVIGLDLGGLLCDAGQRTEGLEILTRSRDGFSKLGRAAMARQVQELPDLVPPGGNRHTSSASPPLSPVAAARDHWRRIACRSRITLGLLLGRDCLSGSPGVVPKHRHVWTWSTITSCPPWWGVVV